MCSYACYATEQHEVGNLHSKNLNKSHEKYSELKSVSSDDVNLKLYKKHSKSRLEQSAFDNIHGAKLKLINLATGSDKDLAEYEEHSIFASSSDNNSSEGSSPNKGGSNSKKQGGSRKQSGSDNNSFINCLSCGLPCSKLDTECKYHFCF